MENLVMPALQSGVFLHKLGKTAAVLTLLCALLLLLKPIKIRMFAYEAFREISAQKMLWDTRKLPEIRGTHFVVRFQPQDREEAGLVLETAEKCFQPVQRNFLPVKKGKILIVVYPTREDLGKSFGWAADESAMGVYWAGVIRVLSPRAWIEDKGDAEVKQVFETQGPMAHELTHLMVDYGSGGNFTRWFTEGIAQFIEAKEAGVILDDQVLTHPGEMYPLAKMDREFDNLPDQSLAYYESYQAIHYLVGHYGEKSLRNILGRLSQGNSMEASFQDELGLSMVQFEENFKKWAIESN